MEEVCINSDTSLNFLKKRLSVTQSLHFGFDLKVKSLQTLVSDMEMVGVEESGFILQKLKLIGQNTWKIQNKCKSLIYNF